MNFHWTVENLRFCHWWSLHYIPRTLSVSSRDCYWISPLEKARMRLKRGKSTEDIGSAPVVP